MFKARLPRISFASRRASDRSGRPFSRRLRHAEQSQGRSAFAQHRPLFHGIPAAADAGNARREMNLSTKQVNRLLQRHFRTSFKQKLLDTRLEMAKDLLRTTDLPVEQIAGEIGYASPHRFYTLFQKKLGMTPNEYRTRQLTDADAARIVPYIAPPPFAPKCRGKETRRQSKKRTSFARECPVLEQNSPNDRQRRIHNHGSGGSGYVFWDTLYADLLRAVLNKPQDSYLTIGSV